MKANEATPAQMAEAAGTMLALLTGFLEQSDDTTDELDNMCQELVAGDPAKVMRVACAAVGTLAGALHVAEDGERLHAALVSNVRAIIQEHGE